MIVRPHLRRSTAAVGATVLLTVLLAGCSRTSTRQTVGVARDELTRIPVADLGTVLGTGSYGSTGVSGDRPTAFVAVRTARTSQAVATTLGQRLQSAGFTPVATCRPPQACLWDRRVGTTLVQALVVVLEAGQPWGVPSTAHGTVAAGTRALVLRMTVGG